MKRYFAELVGTLILVFFGCGTAVIAGDKVGILGIIFVVVILGSTQTAAPPRLAGLAIGITLVAIHLVGINITGTSVNPARSLGPALFVGGQALSQVWLFLTLPSLGGLVAGILFRMKALEATPEPETKEKRQAITV